MVHDVLLASIKNQVYFQQKSHVDGEEFIRIPQDIKTSSHTLIFTSEPFSHV